MRGGGQPAGGGFQEPQVYSGAFRRRRTTEQAAPRGCEDSGAPPRRTSRDGGSGRGCSGGGQRSKRRSCGPREADGSPEPAPGRNLPGPRLRSPSQPPPPPTHHRPRRSVPPASQDPRRALSAQPTWQDGQRGSEPGLAALRGPLAPERGGGGGGGSRLLRAGGAASPGRRRPHPVGRAGLELRAGLGDPQGLLSREGREGGGRGRPTRSSAAVPLALKAPRAAAAAAPGR